MSIGYVIPDLNKNKLLRYIENDMLFGLDPLEYLHLNEYSSENKAWPISVVDAIKDPTPLKLVHESSIFLLDTPDEKNSWFIGYATTNSNPKTILNIITETLNKRYYSEYHAEYEIISYNVNNKLDENVEKIAKLLTEDPDVLTN